MILRVCALHRSVYIFQLENRELADAPAQVPMEKRKRKKIEPRLYHTTLYDSQRVDEIFFDLFLSTFVFLRSLSIGFTGNTVYRLSLYVQPRLIEIHRPYRGRYTCTIGKSNEVVSTIPMDATFEPEAKGGNSQRVETAIGGSREKKQRKGRWEEKTSTVAEAERYGNGSIKHRQMQRYEYEGTF